MMFVILLRVWGWRWLTTHRASRRLNTVEARITDTKGRLIAHATTTCLVFGIEKGSAEG
jgi:hypothetical protein